MVAIKGLRVGVIGTLDEGQGAGNMPKFIGEVITKMNLDFGWVVIKYSCSEALFWASQWARDNGWPIMLFHGHVAYSIRNKCDRAIFCKEDSIDSAFLGAIDRLICIGEYPEDLALADQAKHMGIPVFQYGN